MSILIRKKINLLVCNMAGTIIKDNGILYTSIKKTLREMDYKINSEQQENWYGKANTEILYDVIKNHYSPDDKPWISPLAITNKVKEAEKNLVIELEKNYFTEGKIHLIDKNLLNIFDKLRINGIKIALNTGYPKELQEKIIDHCNLTYRIDAHISSEDVSLGMPAPYMIHRLMEECGVSNVRNVAKIGDTINDLLEGRNAGCGLNIGVLSGMEKKRNLSKYADIMLNDITELKSDDLPSFLL